MKLGFSLGSLIIIFHEDLHRVKNFDYEELWDTIWGTKEMRANKVEGVGKKHGYMIWPQVIRERSFVPLNCGLLPHTMG